MGGRRPSRSTRTHPPREMEQFHLDGAYAASELFAAPLARKSGCALLRYSTHCGNHDVRNSPAETGKA